jgi:delta-aminolevulinic acid dehydratase/porphobilinogen synthase
MSGIGPEIRPRRLRRTPTLRRLVAETSVRPAQLVLPMFVREDADRADADRVDAGCRPAHARLAAQGGR